MTDRFFQPRRAAAIMTILAACGGANETLSPAPVHDGLDASQDVRVDASAGGASAGAAGARDATVEDRSIDSLDTATEDVRFEPSADAHVEGALDAAGELDGADGEGGSTDGCVDIWVRVSTLPNQGQWSIVGGPPIGMWADRDHLWRDATGVHVAWNALHKDGKAEAVVSSYDPATGALEGHRLFSTGPKKGVLATGVAPDGTVGLGVYVAADAAESARALLVIRMDDPSKETLAFIPGWPPSTLIVGVGWDGEAFAVHGYDPHGVQYVARIKPDGTILLAPRPFGKAAGYPNDVRYATDPVGGASYAVSGSGKPWLTGHLRDGTPTPDPIKIQAVPLEPKGLQGIHATSQAIRALPNGAVIAWSSYNASPPSYFTTFIQVVDDKLEASEDAIGIPGESLPGSSDPYFKDYNLWLTIQPIAKGWWIGGTNGYWISEYIVFDGKLTARLQLVTFSGSYGFYVRHFESAEWHDEIWLGFKDMTSTVADEQPFRVVLAKPGCVYKAAADFDPVP
jgi:threonine dehydrogenase-like Zn-dependent dehydrogenase